MEPLQHLHHHVHGDPDLTPLHQYRLHHRLVEHRPGLHPLPHLHQHPHQHAPTPLFLPHILVEVCLVNIDVRYGATQIIELGNLLQGVQIDLICHSSHIKTTMQGLPLAPTVPVEAALVRFVVAVFILPQGYLESAYITVGVQCRVLLEYMYTILPVNIVELISEVASGSRRPGHLGKGRWHFIISQVKLTY